MMNNLTIYATLTTAFMLISLVASNVCSTPYSQYIGIGGTVLVTIFFTLFMVEICKRNNEQNENHAAWQSYIKSRDKNIDNLLNEMIKCHKKQYILLDSVIEKIVEQSKSNHSDIEILLKKLSKLDEENNNNFKMIEDKFNLSIESAEYSNKELIQTLESGEKEIVLSLNNRLEVFSTAYEEKNKELLNGFADKNQASVINTVNLMVEKNREVCEILKMAVGESAEAILNSSIKSIEANNDTIKQFLTKFDEKISENASQIKDVSQCVLNMETVVGNGIQNQTANIKNMTEKMEVHITNQEELISKLGNDLSTGLMGNMDSIFGDKGTFKELIEESIRNIEGTMDHNLDALKDADKRCLKSIQEAVEELPDKLADNNEKILTKINDLVNEHKILVKNMKKWNEDREKLTKEDYELLWSVLKK